MIHRLLLSGLLEARAAFFHLGTKSPLLERRRSIRALYAFLGSLLMNSGPPWKHYKIGDTSATGDKIEEILGIGDKYFLFLMPGGKLGWEFDEKICLDGDASAAEALDLLGQLKLFISDEPGLRSGIGLIAVGLGRAFEDRHLGDDRDFFTDARLFIQARRSEVLQIWYLFSSFGAAAAFGLGALIIRSVVLQPTWWWVAKAGSFGATGAVLSVLLRFREIPIGRYTSRLHTSVAGVVRISLGAGLAAVFVLLQRGGSFYLPSKANKRQQTSLLFSRVSARGWYQTSWSVWRQSFQKA